MLNWSPVDGATTYKVYASDIPDGTYNCQLTNNGTRKVTRKLVIVRQGPIFVLIRVCYFKSIFKVHAQLHGISSIVIFGISILN